MWFFWVNFSCNIYFREVWVGEIFLGGGFIFFCFFVCNLDDFLEIKFIFYLKKFIILRSWGRFFYSDLKNRV